MSTMTQAQPATRDGAPTRLFSPPLALTFLAEFSSLTSFFLLLPAALRERNGLASRV